MGTWALVLSRSAWVASPAWGTHGENPLLCPVLGVRALAPRRTALGGRHLGPLFSSLRTLLRRARFHAERWQVLPVQLTESDPVPPYAVFLIASCCDKRRLEVTAARTGTWKHTSPLGRRENNTEPRKHPGYRLHSGETA